MWKYIVGVAFLLAGVAVVGGCGRQAQTEVPAGSVQPAGQAASETEKIPWLKSLDEAKQAAQAQHKPILVDFFATWCGPCKMMDEETWPQPSIVAAAGKYVPVRLDVDLNQEVATQFGVDSIPTVVLLDSTGKELERNTGFASPSDLLSLLTKHSQ